jgi:hypothetical protein
MGPPPPSVHQRRCERLEKTDTEFHRIFRTFERAAWDDTFVDALCAAGGDFSFGRYSLIMTFNALEIDGAGCSSPPRG